MCSTPLAEPAPIAYVSATFAEPRPESGAGFFVGVAGVAMPTMLPPESDDAIARRERRAERQNDISAIRADLDRLTDLVERYVETQDAQQARIVELIRVLDRVRGGLAVLAWLGGLLAVVGSVASWVIDHWPTAGR